jgi:hypothetical protein
MLKRFNIDAPSCDQYEEAADGEWVKHEDVREMVGVLEKRNADMSEALGRSELRIQELENAADARPKALGLWRTGTKNPHNIYVNDRPAGFILSDNVASIIVATLNRYLAMLGRTEEAQSARAYAVERVASAEARIEELEEALHAILDASDDPAMRTIAEKALEVNDE